MATEHTITFVVTFVFCAMISWVINDFRKFCKEQKAKDVTVTLTADSPPRRITTHVTAEWIDGAYQIIETRIDNH